MSDERRKLSTSALAKQLEVPVQQLFGTLKDYGWIRKVDDGWALTGKGEFEGGEYRHSQRYGRYIVWPPTMVEHPLLQALEDNRMLSAAALDASRQLTGKTVNRALAELGWVRRGFHGWEITERGRKLGGLQLENRQTDMHYVVWPEALRDDPLLIRLLEACRHNPAEAGDDLFAEQEGCQSLDGHRFECRGLQQICQWLYLAGVVHACERQLPVEEELRADFYLPLNQVYIEFWGGGDSPSQLSARMRRRDVYESLQLDVIDIHAEDLEQIDDFLPRQLMRLGVKFQ